MSAQNLDVRLLSVTPNALSLIYAAFRQCYSAGFAADDLPDKNTSELPEADRPAKAAFIRRVLKSGHVSPLEHVLFTFAAQGLSRVATHQLVRHRMASYSQQSQRYVNEKQFDYIVPPKIANNPKALEIFENFMKESAKTYNSLLECFAEAQDKGILEDVRFVLPNACESKIIFSMNCRALLNFFELRCCLRAQWEIRELALRMLSMCQKELPEVFEKAGAKCESLGFCPEGENFTCGRYS